MIHKYTKMISLLLAAVLFFALCPMPVSHAAYTNGYPGGKGGDGMGIYAHGVDLSVWQGPDVDFQKIKAQGYSFVILRAGFATTIDRHFESNYSRAKAAGLDVGVYLYSYADTIEDVLEEAQACKKWLTGKQLEYPVYFDLEDPKTHGSMSKEALTNLALAFLDEMAADGWLVGLYSCLSWLQHKIDTEKVCALYECWMAQYLYSGKYDIYDRYDEVYGMWQYSSSGTVDGVPGRVDMNISFKDYPGICRQYGFNGYAATKESLSLVGGAAPNVIKTGEQFSVQGRVSSGKGDLYDVTLGIYNEAGEFVTGRSYGKRGTFCDLSQLAPGLHMEELPQGKYYYRISATNSSDSRVLLNQPLWVADSGVHIEDVNYPKDLKQGDDFMPSGSLYAAENMAKIRICVKDSKGTVLRQTEAQPKSKSYDLTNLPSGLDLSELPTGLYSYTVEAMVQENWKNLLTREFHIWVREDPLTLSNFKLEAEYRPQELSGLKGFVQSENSAIENIQVYILDAEGETQQSAIFQNLGKNFDLSACQQRMEFSELTIGLYRLKIIAQNDGGPVILADATFLICEDKLSIYELSAPQSLCQGDSFLLSGAIASSDSDLKYVSAGVYDEQGVCVLYSAAVPKSKVFDLDRLNDRFLFSKLPCGNYTLRLDGENGENYTVLYEAPLVVTAGNDRLSWKSGCFTPNGEAYAQSSPFVVWGTLLSEQSNISAVTVEILDTEEQVVRAVTLRPQSREAALESCNEMLRVSALPAQNYYLRVTASNAQGSFVMLNSPFSISSCQHGNVRTGRAYYATCTSCGVVCDSLCLDCGGKVRSGLLLPKLEHEYRNSPCGGCGRAEFLTVQVKNSGQMPEDNERFVIAAKVGQQWYAMKLDGGAVAIPAPNEQGELNVSAELLWTCLSGRENTVLRNPFEKSLHLDSRGICVARGSENTALSFVRSGEGWQISGQNGRYLSFAHEEFTVSEAPMELYLLRYPR